MVRWGKRILLSALVVIVGSLAYAQTATQDVYYLTGNFKEVAGTVVTDKGEQRTTFFGSLGFQVIPGKEGLQLVLIELSLISKGVGTGKGPTGLLSLIQIDDDIVWFDPKTGRFSLELRMVLHYELINQLKGFRPTQKQGEMDEFVPYTEVMKGKITGSFPEALKVASQGRVKADATVELELSQGVLGDVRRITLVLQVYLDWTKLLRPAQILKIQPVFIGTGPTDPNRTGRAFDELMRQARELWARCGTVRCIDFSVNDPIYLDKPAYKVLESTAEADNLTNEVNVTDAVEVFVVDRMTFVCDWGGGKCYSLGTAAAKIVSCDQQLSVPAPCPCPDYCPSTCPPCPPCQTGALNYYHLAHELGHALNLYHPPHSSSTAGSIMEPSGFCCDNPNVQSAKNCRNASNPLLYWGSAFCLGKPDIAD